MKKKINFIALIMTFLLLFTGCGHKTEVNGDVLFSCNPDNVLGIESVYINDGLMYIQFDKEYVFTDAPPLGVQSFFSNGQLSPANWVWVYTTDDVVEFEADDVVVDADAMILSFSSNGLDPEKIIGVGFILKDSYSESYNVAFDNNNIWGEYRGQSNGKDCILCFSQKYNSLFDSWGNVLSDFGSYVN